VLDVNDLIVDSPIGLEPYRPHLRYCLIDENEYTKHELEALRNLVAALFRLEKGQNEGNRSDPYSLIKSLC
jgi:hypothetical protein